MKDVKMTVQEKLIELLKIADENICVLCGDGIFYMKDGEQFKNKDYSWGFYFDDIVQSDKFICETENMQLIIKLK